jgi:uncharacterized protein YbbC (DUF1343 family)
VGLVTNHTGRLSTGEPLVDALLRRGVQVVRMFGPEHGIRGVAAAGEKVRDSVDASTGIPVLSLYGTVRKPTSAMLSGIDLLVYDLQDVGVRFYTYISTMALTMEAAAERGIPFVVLDRPNPLGGILIDGPLLEDSLRSFVGIARLPVVYGLTCGELALMLNEEKMLTGGVRADLTVVTMDGWQRLGGWSDTGREWIPPSPSLRSEEAALIYPATCLIEGTNVSEGRGTDQPYLTLGAPFIDGSVLADQLNGLRLQGVRFEPVEFTPVSSKHAGKSCGGVRIAVQDPSRLRPTETGMRILAALRRLYPDHLEIRRSSFLRLIGSAEAYDVLASAGDLDDLLARWQIALEEFGNRSQRYWIYGKIMTK